MRVLLDENLDPRIGEFLLEHEVESVRVRGWRGIQNGELLRLAASEFDAFLTLDRGIVHQQNLSALTLRIVVIRAINNRLETISPLVPRVLETLLTIQPGQCLEVGTEPPVSEPP